MFKMSTLEEVNEAVEGPGLCNNFTRYGIITMRPYHMQ
jgi:hypothetical protein